MHDVDASNHHVHDPQFLSEISLMQRVPKRMINSVQSVHWCTVPYIWICCTTNCEINNIAWRWSEQFGQVLATWQDAPACKSSFVGPQNCLLIDVKIFQNQNTDMQNLNRSISPVFDTTLRHMLSRLQAVQCWILGQGQDCWRCWPCAVPLQVCTGPLCCIW